MEQLKILKEKYNAWLVVEYNSNQDNTERTLTTDYIVLTDDKNYFINGGREEKLHLDMFKNYLDRVAEKLNGERKEKDNHIFEFGRFAYKETHKYLEVIGNIYENHEILECKE